MSVGSHKCTLKYFENKNCLIFSGLNYVIIRQVFIFILICFLSNEWNFLQRMLLIEKHSAYFNPRCSHSHSFLEACFCHNSLFWPSVIMLFFTLYSALKCAFSELTVCVLERQGAVNAWRAMVEVLGEYWGSSTAATGKADWLL